MMSGRLEHSRLSYGRLSSSRMTLEAGGAGSPFVTYRTPIAIGAASTGDFSTMTNALTGGTNPWGYFTSYNTTTLSTDIAVTKSTDGGVTWPTPTVAFATPEPVGVGPSDFENHESPSVIYVVGVAAYLFTTAYQTAGAADPTNYSIVLTTGDGTTFSTPNIVLTKGSALAGGISLDDYAAWDGCFKFRSGTIVDGYYTAGYSVGGLSILWTSAPDSFTFGDFKVVLEQGVVPTGAGYHGYATPSVRQQPVTGRWYMLFSAMKSDWSPYGGIGLAYSDSVNGDTGWVAGPNLLLTPQDTELVVTGPDLRFSADGLDMIIETSVQLADTSIVKGGANVSVADALAIAGL